MIKSNEGQTAVDGAAKQLRADQLKKQSRAYQLEAALNLTDEWIDALMKTQERYLHALANDDELFGPGVQVALDDRSDAITALLEADKARQQIEW